MLAPTPCRLCWSLLFAREAEHGICVTCVKHSVARLKRLIGLGSIMHRDRRASMRTPAPRKPGPPPRVADAHELVALVDQGVVASGDTVHVESIPRVNPITRQVDGYGMDVRITEIE